MMYAPNAYFAARFPLCVEFSRAHNVLPVQTNGVEHEAYDSEELRAVLGPERFGKLMGEVKDVLSCGHRLHPADHPDPNFAEAEVHCVWARDLERFLQAEGH